MEHRVGRGMPKLSPRVLINNFAAILYGRYKNMVCFDDVTAFGGIYVRRQRCHRDELRTP